MIKSLITTGDDKTISFILALAGIEFIFGGSADVGLSESARGGHGSIVFLNLLQLATFAFEY